MKLSFFLLYPLLWTFICSDAVGRPIAVPSAVSALIQRADPHANVEYCGRVSTNRVDYYLFVLTGGAHRRCTCPAADWKYTGHRGRRYLAIPIGMMFPNIPLPSRRGKAIEELLSRRNLQKTCPATAPGDLESNARDQRRWTRHRPCRVSDLRFSTWF